MENLHLSSYIMRDKQSVIKGINHMKSTYLIRSICLFTFVLLAIQSQAQEIIEEFVVDVGGSVFDFAWSPDGEFIAVGNYEEIQVIDVEEQVIMSSISTTSHSIAWNPDGSQIASYSLIDNSISIFDIQSGELENIVNGISEINDMDDFISVRDLTWNECGLFSINGAVDLFIWGESEFLLEPLRLSGHSEVVINTMITDDCRTIVTSAADAKLRIWSIESGENTLSLDVRRAFTIQNDELFYFSPNKEIIKKSLGSESSEVIYKISKDEGILSMDWSSDERLLSYTSNIGEIIILSPSDSSSLRIIPEDSLYNVVLWHPFDFTLVSVDNMGMLRVWEFAPVDSTDRQKPTPTA